MMECRPVRDIDRSFMSVTAIQTNCIYNCYTKALKFAISNTGINHVRLLLIHIFLYFVFSMFGYFAQMCMYASVYYMYASTHGGQKRVRVP